MENYIETDIISEDTGGEATAEVTEKAPEATAEAAETAKKTQMRQRARSRARVQNPRRLATQPRKRPMTASLLTAKRQTASPRKTKCRSLSSAQR